MVMIKFLTQDTCNTMKAAIADQKKVLNLGFVLPIKSFSIQSSQLQPASRPFLPVMAAVAVRKKVVRIGHFSPRFFFQSLQIFLLVRSNQEHLHVLVALLIREI